MSVDVVKKQKLVIITVNRPEALNALNGQLIEELRSTVDEVNADPDTVCAVLTGAGKAFVAGADIKELVELNRETGYEKMRTGQSLMDSLEKSPKVWIAAVNGYALGGGLELALACDIRLASEKAKMGLPEVGLGLIPGYGGTQRLVKSVGMGWAKRLVLSGEIIDAQTALNIGLVQGVYPPEDLVAEAEKMAQAIAAKAPLALTAAKRSVLNAVNMPMEQGLEEEARLFGEMCETQDAKEGLKAFLEKRSPDFKTR